MTQIGIGNSHRQPMKDKLHVLVIRVCPLVKLQHMLVVLILVRLVENAQHLVEPVVYLSMQAGYLHNDAVVCQALHKGIGQPFRHKVAVVVE